MPLAFLFPEALVTNLTNTVQGARGRAFSAIYIELGLSQEVLVEILGTQADSLFGQNRMQYGLYVSIKVTMLVADIYIFSHQIPALTLLIFVVTLCFPDLQLDLPNSHSSTDYIHYPIF